MDFGVGVTWVALPKRYARPFAHRIRTSIIEAFGDLPCNKSKLPIIVKRSADRNDVIELRFPQPVGILAANPELWLALTEVIGDVLNEIERPEGETDSGSDACSPDRHSSQVQANTDSDDGNRKI